MVQGTSKSKKAPLKCPERKRLGEAMMVTVERTYRAKAELDTAPKTKLPNDLLRMLSKAGSAERKAEIAFCEHIEKHGCSE